MPLINFNFGGVPVDLPPPSEGTSPSSSVTSEPADFFEPGAVQISSSDAVVPAESSDVGSGGWSSLFSYGGSALKSALNTGVSYVGDRISGGVSVANALLVGAPEPETEGRAPIANVFDQNDRAEERVSHRSNGQTVYSKTLYFSGAKTLEQLGSGTSDTTTLRLDDVELVYAAQTLLDLSRGEAGTQDFYIGGAEVDRENTGGHVTLDPNWRSDPQWFKESLGKLYALADSDVETTRLLTTFINQRTLNNLIYNLQDSVNQKMDTLILMGDVKMSWRVVRVAPSEGAPEELCVRAVVAGTVPYAEVAQEMVPEMGSFRGTMVLNLTRNTARATLRASLDSKKLGMDSSTL